MNYVEMLRVRRTLLVLAMILGALVVLAAVLRVSVKSTVVGDVSGSDIEDTAIHLTISAFVGWIVATIFGAAFARENGGHLELAFTRPISRERLGLVVMATDAAGIVIAEAMTLVATLIAHAFYAPPGIGFDSDAVVIALAAIVGPLAWYAFLNAATASLKRNAGSILGFSWPVALALAGVAHATFTTPIGNVVHMVAWAISRIVPLTYAQTSFDDDHFTGVSSTQLETLALLFVVYGALAIWQWRRVEA
jgi:hypothetical protein